LQNLQTSPQTPLSAPFLSRLALFSESRRGLPAHADHSAGDDDDRAALRRCARRRGTPHRGPDRRARAARAAILPTPTGCRTASSISGASGFRILLHRDRAAAPARERYFADGSASFPDNRRLAILVVCAVEWETFAADPVVETHDRIVGRTYREAARTRESQLGDETAAVREALRAFAELGRGTDRRAGHRRGALLSVM